VIPQGRRHDYRPSFVFPKPEISPSSRGRTRGGRTAGRLPRREGWLPVRPLDGVRQIKSKVNPRRALPACARSRYPPSRSTGHREYGIRSPAAGSNGILPPGKGEIRPFYRGNASFSPLSLFLFLSLASRLLAARTRGDRSIAISIHAPAAV